MQMKKAFWVVVGVVLSSLLVTSETAGAFDIEEKLDISGYLKNATAWRVSADNSSDMLKSENILQVEPSYRLSNNVNIRGIFRGYYDAVFDLEKSGWTDKFSEYGSDREEIRYKNNDTVSDPVRELYAEIELMEGRLFMKLGKQQVAWGEAIGARMLDVVNPADLRELNQLDFEDSRIPLWMANIECATPIRGSRLQLLLIPDLEPAYLAPAGHPFALMTVNTIKYFQQQGLIDLAGKQSHQVESVPQNLKNMEIGVKWYQNLTSWEYTLNYLYHWTDGGGFYPGEHPFSPTPTGLPLNYDVLRKRLHTVGGSFNKMFKKLLGHPDVMIRGEIAAHLEDRLPYVYTPNKQVFIDPNNPFCLEMAKSNTVNYLLGVDTWFFTDYYVSFQFYQFINLDHQSGYVDLPLLKGLKPVPGGMGWDIPDAKKVNQLFTLYTTADYFQERVKPDLLWVYSDDGAWWFRGRCNLKVTDEWYVSVGTNLYFGERDNTFFGSFTDVDNAFVEVKYAFSIF